MEHARYLLDVHNKDGNCHPMGYDQQKTSKDCSSPCLWRILYVLESHVVPFNPVRKEWLEYCTYAEKICCNPQHALQLVAVESHGSRVDLNIQRVFECLDFSSRRPIAEEALPAFVTGRLQSCASSHICRSGAFIDQPNHSTFSSAHCGKHC